MKVKKTIFTISIITCLNLLWAQFPVQDMSRKTLGAKGSMGFRGQNITDANVPSHETMPFLMLGYAPFSFLLLDLGLGFNKFRVEEFQDGNQTREFEGGFGFSPSAGVSLFSPFFANGYLRIAGGVNIMYWSSGDEYGYTYYGAITDPFLGLIVSPSQYVDLGIGGKGHFVDGAMKIPSSTGNDPWFANEEIIRGYLSLMIKSPHEGVFLHLGFEASPEISNDWSNGPPEAAVHISIGMLLEWKERKKPEIKQPMYFPEYPEVRKTADKMKEDME